MMGITAPPGCSWLGRTWYKVPYTPVAPIEFNGVLSVTNCSTLSLADLSFAKVDVFSFQFNKHVFFLVLVTNHGMKITNKITNNNLTIYSSERECYGIKMFKGFFPQTFQVPKMELLTNISCM